MENSGYYRQKAWRSLSKYDNCMLMALATLVGSILPLWIRNVWMLDSDPAMMSFICKIISSCLLGILEFGLMVMAIDTSREKKIQFSQLFAGFQNLDKVLGVYILKFIYVLGWMLLFIIPGIIKSLSYSMAFFVLEENPTMKADDAICESMRLMDGHKWDLFVLILSFIGWFLLTIITFGLAAVVVAPYVRTSYAHFYDDLKKEKGSCVELY